MNDLTDTEKVVIGWFCFLVYLCQPQHYVLMQDADGNGWLYDFWTTPEGSNRIF